MFKKEEFTASGGDISGFIGRGMNFEGKLNFEGTVRLDGNFKGELTSRGTLLVGDDAHIEATIKVDTAVITGEVKGQVEAANRVELKSPAKMFGDIKTPNLIIGEGVIFEGNCVMAKKEKATSGPIEFKPAEQKGS